MNLSLSTKFAQSLLFTVGLAAPVMAQNLTTFVNGQTADANAVNANFNTVKSVADAASSAAGSAQNTANSAQATADGAQATASAAQANAAAAQTAINAVTNVVSVVGGNVGIGTNTPQGKLHLAGSGVMLRAITSNGPTMKLGSGSGQEWDLFAGAQDFAISRSGVDFPFIIRSDNGGVSINNNGTVTSGFKMEVGGNIRCVNLTQTSNRELKTDVAPIVDALEKVMRLRSVSYAWNDEAPVDVRGDRDLGFIADEVDDVLPEIVAKDDAGKPVGIAYGKITSVAVGAIQELKRQNDALRAENDALRVRLEALEASVAALQPLLAARK